jgi:predicted transcriptional regulator
VEEKRARGVLEQEVLAVLAVQDAFLTAGQVLAALDRDLAYTTVLTVLSRLHEKGLVERTRRGRGHAYRWIPAGVELAAHQMGRLLEAEHNRAAVLARFVDSLSAQDESLLVGLLRREGRPRPPEGAP